MDSGTGSSEIQDMGGGSKPWLPLPARFKPIKTLGDGAAGVVYHAKDLGNGGREIALKILTDVKAFDEHTVERFRDELKVCQQLRHPNIVEAYELLRINGCLAFSMEYVPGSDLSRLFKKKRFTGHQIDLIFDQLLSALEELHALGILHRDIKLENILLRHDGTIKLSDLGLMKQYQKELTADGVVLGTAHYLPPEYLREGKYDVRSEIYVLGTMLFEMVTGKRWLADFDGPKAIKHLLKTKFAFPLESLIDVDKKYRRILERTLAYNPSDRFQNVVELRKAFEGTGANLAPLHSGDTLEPKMVFNTTELNLMRSGSHRLWRKRLFIAWLALVCVAAITVVIAAIRFAR